MCPLRAVLFCILLLGGSISKAQSPADTVQFLQSFRADEDSLQDAPLTADHDITRVLSEIPGSFVYDFKTFSWPNAWSIYGLAPHSVQLNFGPIPFDDLLTGRPRYDLLPTALLRNPQRNSGLSQSILGIQAELGTIHAKKPYTQLHYQAGDHSLQRVTALHAQQRGRLFRRPGHFQGVFGYAGASDSGDYPGSRLQRLRQLLLRARYQRLSWSLELLYLHNQRRLGAHSGVLGEDDRRYNRLIAQVVSEDHTRRTVRNDFLSTFKTRHVTASIYLSTQNLSYVDTDGASRRVGASIQRQMRLQRHRFGARIDGYWQQIHKGNALAQRREFSLITGHVSDSLIFKAGYIFAQAGFENTNGSGWSSRGGFRGEVTFHRLTPYIEIDYGGAGQPSPGWGNYLGLSPETRGNLLLSNAGVKLRHGQLFGGSYGFLTRAENVPDYQEIVPDSMDVIYDSYTASGVGIWFILEPNSDRGVYFGLNSGFLQTGRTQSTSETVLPKWTLSGHFGIRTVLFKEDLRLDISLRGRWWSAMTSRTLHAPTGLLALPSYFRQPIQESYILDVAVKGKIRTATVYVFYENLTSGTGLMAGNELVADYPLPARQLRFGVYWPIHN